MSWAQRRKATYILSILFVIIIIFFIIIFSFFHKTPTCFDGIQNQNETGVDCGGPCSLLCRAEYSNPTILWVRWSKVLGSGTYNVLAYANNSNIDVGALSVPYFFKIYDKENVLLYSGLGSTYIPPSNNFVVFSEGVNIGDKVPARIVFEFQGNFAWQKIKSKELNVTAISKVLVNEDTSPKLLVTLKNTSLLSIENIESVAILYDENDNAIAFSKTKVDSIDSDNTADIVFTWPEKFEKKVYKIEIISKVLPSSEF